MSDLPPPVAGDPPLVDDALNRHHVEAVLAAAVKAERTGRWSGIAVALKAAREAGMAWAEEQPPRTGSLLSGVWRNYEDGGRPGL